MGFFGSKKALKDESVTGQPGYLGFGDLVCSISESDIRQIARNTTGEWLADPSNRKVGDVMPDGTIVAGISPDTGKMMCAMPQDAGARMDFNAAAKHAEELNKEKALSHDDWRVPTKEELNVLFQNREKGALKGTFSLTGPAGWYWSSTPTNADNAWVQQFSDGLQVNYHRLFEPAVRCVR